MNSRKTDSLLKEKSILRIVLSGCLVLVLFSNLAIALSGCNLLKQATTQNKPGASGANPQTEGRLNGYWKLAYQVNNDVAGCHFQLKQNGSSFSGVGADDHNQKAFLVENGHLQGMEVVFYKRYEQPNDPSQPPVEFIGKLDLSGQNAYMSGGFDGLAMKGQWEAQREGANPQEAQAAEPGGEQQPQEEQQAPPQAMRPDKPPDLSGKWNAGYEYNFKTMHATMFLEQLKEKITGHGIDENTNEKFLIENGFYYPPKVTLMLKYNAIKVKDKVVKPERRMTFKADVNWVNDADYQGPYLSGKTDGGGNWEAQLVR
ncbi:MAG: hypothetical protein K2Z81_00005 [Cyanobacteria bacterium]|nr:hypothetical protein [Cyanobacteriota bacterium]